MECRNDALCRGVQIGRKVGQDILRQEAVARRVEQLPAVGIDPLSGPFELARRLQKARKVMGIDWDHEPWTGKTAAKPRTQAFRHSA